ncbi:hypothetical protein GF340_02340, partial [Candidatus Peregrinibacteria bacterium]|nr:hypothetical protein [Candidatus Peregrinibacteria bacterium]
MNKIDQIKDLFQQNYFFYAEEIDKFVEKARFMKEEGLNVLIDFLKKAKQHQDRFFAERIN